MRKAGDLVDINNIVRHIETLEPIRQDSKLLNVVIGVRVSSSINEDGAKSIETIEN